MQCSVFPRGGAVGRLQVSFLPSLGSHVTEPSLQGEPLGVLPLVGPPRCCPSSLCSLPPTVQDVKRCLNALEELGTLQVTSHILQKNTDVVATLKKVRRKPEVGGAGGRRVPAGQGLLRASGFLTSGLASGSSGVQGRCHGDGSRREGLGPGGEASGAS